jgi:hypothetical protein
MTVLDFLKHSLIRVNGCTCLKILTRSVLQLLARKHSPCCAQSRPVRLHCWPHIRELHLQHCEHRSKICTMALMLDMFLCRCASLLYTPDNEHFGIVPLEVRQPLTRRLTRLSVTTCSTGRVGISQWGQEELWDSARHFASQAG